MKKIFLLFALMSALCVQSIGAQAIKGDMNDDAVIDVLDVNKSINVALGLTPIEYLPGNDVDNSLIAGTWYTSKSVSYDFNADGTTDYPGAVTYKYIPSNFCILLLDANGKVSGLLNVVSLQDGVLIVNPMGTGEHITMTNTQPVQLVTSIKLTPSSISMQPREAKVITATVLPEDADNKNVTWSVDKSEVATLIGDLVFAVSEGVATITCSSTDGSGIKATCKVIVGNPQNHEWVDLGLPGGVLWATCNVGADKPEDYGLYFAWGETTGYAKGESHTFNWANYKWMTPGQSGRQYLTKYTTSDGQKSGCWYDGDTYVGTTVDGVTYKNLTELLPEDDAATANWGTDWRMPTRQEIEDLCNSNYTTAEWVTVNGVKGRKITSKSNGNSIFLPAAGLRGGSSLYGEGSGGDYWSSSLSTSKSDAASNLGFDSIHIHRSNSDRYYGQSVRAVLVASE